MSILQATSNDLIEILYLLKVCFNEMNAKRLFHMDSQSAFISSDIKKGNIYLYKKNGVTLGMMILDMENLSESTNSSWVNDSGNPLVVHCLEVHPNWRGMGIESEIAQFMEQFALLKGYTSVRIDVLSENSDGIMV